MNKNTDVYNGSEFTLQELKALSSANYLLDILEEYSICDCSNLKLQKLLYFAYGIFLSSQNKPLFEVEVQAWKLGPVFPVVYKQFKNSGRDAIKTRVHTFIEDIQESILIDYEYFLTKEEQKILDITCVAEGNKRARKLVDATHLPNSAWSQVYHRNTKNIIIPDELIRKEFDNYVPTIEQYLIEK